MSTAITMVLQFRKIGPWRDYLAGEKTYMVMSLVAKSLLAWQVFAGRSDRAAESAPDAWGRRQPRSR